MALVISASPALAASSTINAYPYNSYINKSVPIREGGWNGTNGFGYRKICDYHNLCSLDALRYVYKSPNYTTSGSHYNLNAWAQKIVCYGTSCYASQEVQVRGVFDSTVRSTYYGYSVGGVLGAQTAHCFGYSPRCPTWVNTSLQNACSKTYGTASTTMGTAADDGSRTPEPASPPQRPDAVKEAARDKKFTKEELSAVTVGEQQPDGSTVFHTASSEPVLPLVE